MGTLETSSKFALYTPTYWLLRLTTISGANFLNSVDELDKPLPKAMSCKVIAVLKTFSFLSNIKCLCLWLSLSGTLLSVWQGQLMTSLETSTNVLYTQTYWLLGLLCSMEKITHSYKNEKKKKMSPGYCPLKGDVNKINNLFLAPRLFGVKKYLYSIFHCNLIWLYIRLYFFLNKGILTKLSRGSTYNFIFL